MDGSMFGKELALTLRLHKFAFQSYVMHTIFFPNSPPIYSSSDPFQCLSFPHYNEMNELVYFKRNPFVNLSITCFAISQDPARFMLLV